MPQNKLLLIFLATMIMQFTFAQDGSFVPVSDIESVKEKIRSNAEKTNSVSSEFVQEKHLTMMEEVLISEGRFFFKKENKIRWEYIKPITYAIIINGSSFTINNDGKISQFDAESNNLFKEINNMIVMAIQGNFVDDPEYIANFFQNDKHILATLKPNNELLENILTDIEIYFSREDMSVEIVKFIEPGGDFTRTSFNNRKVNIEISDDQFNAN